jgi:hypothetical protein
VRKSFVILLLLFSINLKADEFADEFSEEASSSTPTGLEFTGMVEIEQAGNISGSGAQRVGDRSSVKEWIQANRRFRIKTSKTSDKGALFAKVDFLRDDIINSTDVDIRELRLKYTPLPWMDISVGRQVSTWGVADMLFINDLFPKNWMANFTGQDMEMMKDPSNSFRATSYFGKATLDVVYHPQFAPDTTPTGCRVGIYNANSGTVIKNHNSCTGSSIDQKNSSYDDGELAASLKYDIAGFQVALYGYHGRFKNPKGMKGTAGSYTGFYPRLDVYGASFEGQIGPGILSSEYGYYNSKEDPNGDNGLIENSLMKGLVGYKIDLSGNFTLGTQWYTEKMSDYDKYEAGMKASGKTIYKDKLHNTFTVRGTFKAYQETLWVNLFVYFRPNDKDSFIKLDFNKRLDNNFSVAAGVNIFSGKKGYEDREFAMLKDDDNFFMRLRYDI